MYQSLQRIQLIIILDGVKSDEIPDEFRGRFYCKFLKKFSIKDNLCSQLMGLVLDEKPLVIDVKALPDAIVRESPTSKEISHEQ